MLTKDDVTMLVFAYRYAVGRKTYAPGLACDYIASKIPEMSKQQVEEMIDEVKHTLQYQEYADDIALNEVNKLFCRLCRDNIHVRNWFYDDDEEQIWALVVHDGRYCYWGCKTKDVFFDNLDFYNGCEQGKRLLLDKIIHDGFDPAKLPYIEDASPAIQQLWYNVTDSENCMWFVDDENLELGEGYEPWEVLKLTKEEYQKQIDTDIKKYHLEDVITKYEDTFTTYTCYGGLQTKFSGKDKL